MAIISTTESSPFTIPAAGDWRFKVRTGRARLQEQNADGTTYSTIADIPLTGQESAVVIATSTVANTVYRWVPLQPGTAVQVDQ